MRSPVEVVENVWIPLADGTRLAARLWLPEDAHARPVPVVLEAIPYRKRDMTRDRDERLHPYFAARGYAAVRLDVRGTGDSDGVIADEYSEREQLDNLEAIAWLAAQPWSSGSVGMIGISWGGFAALQAAARRPPALDAVVVVCASDDRWSDDAHYMGGCLLSENLVWGSIFFTQSARPPDPEVVGEGWRARWRERLEALEPFAARWLEHPRRDAYWRHGSLRPDYRRVRCPVLAVGGWADAYRNAVPRLLAGLDVPRRGLVGPWAHVYPHDGVPGPPIDFPREATAWWDRWLGRPGSPPEGRRPATDPSPLYRAWMPAGPPVAGTSPGRWVAESSWPSPRVEERSFRLGSTRASPVEHHSAQSVGLAAGGWTGFGMEGEELLDQRGDDERSLVFDLPPLDRPLEILGTPVAELVLSVDRPSAFVAARLCAVAPGGASTRVGYGLLDLTHPAADEPAATGRDAGPLVPGRRYRVRLALQHAAWSFASGTRIRLALSTAYWPVVWPSPAPVGLTVHPAESSLVLPVRPPDPADAELAPLPPPRPSRQDGFVDLVPDRSERTVERTGGRVTVTTTTGAPGGGLAWYRIEPIDLELGRAIVERFSIDDRDPTSARGEIHHRFAARRGGDREWRVEVESRSILTSSAAEHVLEAELVAREAGREVASRRWLRRVARSSWTPGDG